MSFLASPYCGCTARGRREAKVLPKYQSRSLFLCMRLCAAGKSKTGQNKRELIQGLACFTPTTDDCRLVQRVANDFLELHSKFIGSARGLDLGLARSLCSDGLFNTRISGNDARSASSSAEVLPIENQGLSVFVTSLPSNLYSGTQAQDDEHEIHYGCEAHHLLNSSHPGQIDETTNWWGTPLRLLLRDPPESMPWLQSYYLGIV